LHSRLAGEAATRGGRTSVEGAVARPACANSLSPRGRPSEVAFICSRRSQVAMLQTNSPLSTANAFESLVVSLEKPTICGQLAKPLK
jgi:hypothetical protein